MIARADLNAAVAAGAISEAQAARLIALSEARRGARENLRDIDEPFELFRGFNEIFIVTGLVILAIGWSGIVVALAAFDSIPDFGMLPWLGVAGAGVLWLLSEYFVRRRRMVAPAIALVVLFALNSFLSALGSTLSPFDIATDPVRQALGPIGIATAATTLHWARFRVPFALALVAVGLFALALCAGAMSSDAEIAWGRELFLLSSSGPFGWITLLLGFGVFATAMQYDFSDPNRVTRRAANGFWLHLVAAPMLVNTVALTLIESGGPLSRAGLAAFLLLIALVAIVIDRRSFLIAAAGYMVVLIETFITSNSFVWLIFALGLLLLTLGAFWERIRAAVLLPLSRILPLDRLPPAFAKDSA